LWICKYCEMQNEDWENECYLCGKPQKEPEPVVIKEEPVVTTIERISSDPSYKDVQPAFEDFAAAFELSVSENEEYEPIEEDVPTDYSDFEEVGSVEETEDETYLEPLYDAEPMTEGADEDIKIFVPEQEKTVVYEPTAPLQPVSIPAAPIQPVVIPIPDEKPVAPPVQRSPFVFENPAVPPVHPTPPASPKVSATDETKKTTDFNLQQFLSQIKQIESDNITEEIRRKQEERKNQQPASPIQDTPSAQNDVNPRVLKKQKKAAQRQESVAIFCKGMKKITMAIIVIFLLITAAFVAVCLWNRNGENLYYVIDEILYSFELQLRDFLYSIQY